MFEDKSIYKIGLEIEFAQDLHLSHHPKINLSILSYFGNKMGIPLLF